MKKLFFAAIAATILFTSCEKGSEVQPEPLGETAKLTIGITSPETVRAVGDKVPDDSKVIDFMAFVVDGDNSIKSGYSNNGRSLEGIEAISVHTTAKKVYVIANAGELALTSESAIKDYIADLNTANKGLQTTARWATKDETINPGDFKLQTNNEFIATKTLELTFISARIKVKIVKKDDMETHYDNGAKNSKDLKITGVHVLNARGASKLFDSPLVTTPLNPAKTFYEGLANNKFVYYPTGQFTESFPLLSDMIPDDDNKSPYNLNNSTYYYYVFENNADKVENYPTIVTIAGTYDDQPIYFPVHLAKYEKFSDGTFENTLQRGNSYEITITLTGDPRFDEGGSYPGKTGGVVDPTNPAVLAKINVSIKIIPWNVVPLEKTF